LASHTGAVGTLEPEEPGAHTHSSGSDAPGPARATVMLLRLLRAAQPISRAELARRVGVNRSTVTDTFKPLIAAGIVWEEPVNPPSGTGRTLGRPPTALSFSDEHGFFVGVNVGVRRTTIGLATLTGDVLADEEFETPSEPSDALLKMKEVTGRLTRRARGGRKLRVIGVSVPGPTDALREKITYAPHLGWHDVAVAAALRFDMEGESATAETSVPVVVENDATAAALYELRLRLGRAESKRLDDFVVVRSGTGLGVGLVIGGEVFRGDASGEGLAGEFGHMTIVAGGKLCRCGNRGCWEMYASASAASSLYVGDRVQLGGQSAPRFVEIVARAEVGELRAQRTLERLGEYLGIGIANVITGLGVTRVIVSGRLVYGWRFLREPLHNAVAQSMAGRLSGWSVEPGEATGAGLGGALEVAAEGFLTSGLV
jgi:predicted NBD/HSP70 family sugar kinase